jgi:hypothetical protein
MKLQHYVCEVGTRPVLEIPNAVSGLLVEGQVSLSSAAVRVFQTVFGVILK